MGSATDSIKSLLAVKIKPRQDGYCDQFIRIFMLKVLMAGTLLVGLNWYSDKIICIIPSSIGMDKDFVSSACWINGLYVYREIRFHADDVGYYGIPRDINMDGMFPNGQVCATTDTSHKPVPGCKPMEKTFFLQYQYMTFLLLAMGVLYYAPYVVFRKVNEDMVSLKGTMKDGDAATIVKNYFSDKVNPKSRLRLRILGDIFVKVLYVVSTVTGFLITDGVLNGGFIGYGGNWLDWSKLKNAIAYDYMGKRHFPKPGNLLLPSFGFCEVHEAAQDIKTVVTNKHRFVCEMSQHILYQYVFIIIWFTMIASIIVSVIGLLNLVMGHILTATCFLHNGPPGKSMYKKLALRECQYLEFLRRKNLPLYSEVVVKLKESRSGSLQDDDDGSIPLKESF